MLQQDQHEKTQVSRTKIVEESRLYIMGSRQQLARGESAEKIPHSKKRRLHKVSKNYDVE